MPVKIYKIDISPASWSVLMIAEVLKLKCETVDVDLSAGEHTTPEYLDKNPQHTVPLLEEGDFVLADSHAILTYLVSKYGAEKRAELYPNDLGLRATVHHRLFFDASILFPAVRAIVQAALFAKLAELNEKQIADVNEGYEVLERYLQKTKFVACDYLTLADVSIVATISSAEVLVPIDEKYPKLNAWLNHLKNEDWYQTANVPTGLIQFEGFMKMMLKNNGS